VFFFSKLVFFCAKGEGSALPKHGSRSTALSGSRD
jgi:hypothetical protein